MLDIEYHKEFLDINESRALYLFLKNNVIWKEEYIKIFGKLIRSPRKIFWYGDEGINYKYSNNIHYSEGWIKEIYNIKTKIENLTNQVFNFVLLNYYEDGNDYMGFHSDNEKSLGKNPFIASLSLYSERLMIFKNKITKKLHKLYLENGSLLLMKGNTQEEWLHSIPKRKNLNEPRINLTFRLIKNS